jgi:retron-type reverse transcriptase
LVCCALGGIVSPILANIYLNELDSFAKKLAKEFHKSRDRLNTLEYDKIAGKSNNYRLKPVVV